MLKGELKLDYLREKEGLSPKKTKKTFKVLTRIFLVFFAFLLCFAFIFSYKLLSFGQEIFSDQEKKSSLFSQFSNFVFPQNKKLDGQKDGRTNFLLLGMGGEGHEGATLTDTIIIASINFNKDKNDLALVSFPRDLYVPYEDYGYYKLNTVYTYAEEKEALSGGKVMAKVISEIIDLPIHYYVRIDFEGFVEIINTLGGIDVYVERSFYDPEYPTSSYGWQTVSFEKGLQHMNGDEALKFARSRHGIVTEEEGDEASDFARAARQQKILLALRNKALSFSTIINPKKINDLLETLGDHLLTNLELWEMIYLAELAQNIQEEEIITKVIDDNETSGFLYATTTEDGTYILMPREKDFEEIKYFMKNIFDFKDIKKEGAKISVLNGSKIKNFAQDTAKMLTQNDLEIIAQGNAYTQDIKKTTIYDFSSNSKPFTIKLLKNKLKADLSNNFPSKESLLSDEEKTNEELKEKIISSDIIIVLGKESFRKK